MSRKYVGEVGMGDKTRFWIDAWVKGNCLANFFLRLFLILEQKENLVGGDGVWKEDSWSWEFKWRREMFEWERKLTLRLTNLLQNEQVHRANLDVWIWLDSPLGVYSTNSAYISRFCEEGQEELNTFLLEVWKL